MSIQAVAWALEQDIPARPKLVLVSIANHADHRTGYCWLKAETIADEASCSVRGIYNFIGDLVRNGFVRKSSRRGDDGKHRATDYWLLFDRVPVAWLKDRQPEDGVDVESEPDDDATSCDPSAPRADGGDTENDTADEPENAQRADGPSAPACTRKESLEEPSKTNPQSSARANDFAAPPRRYKPPPVEPQGDTHRQTTERIFVIAGTEAWKAWMDYRKRVLGKPQCATYRKFVEGRGWRDGWDFPSLFPPSEATGPPKESAEVA